MRTLGTRSHLLLAIAAAAALIGTLGLPWYGAAPRVDVGEAELAARAEAVADTVSRALTAPDGTAGWDALARADVVLAALAGAVIVLVLLSPVPALTAATRELARLAAGAALGLVAWCVVDVPGTALEPRNGLLAGLGTAALLVASTSALAAAPHRRRAPARAYVPPSPPPRDTTASYGPPQY
jgi:hypothetical protein